MNLHKNVKGILVHNGYFFVADIMKHFHKISKKDRPPGTASSNNLDFEIELIHDIKTDPSLDQD